MNHGNFSASIFRTEDFDEIDETWRSGTYIGGLAGAHQDAGIATSYRNAAELIVNQSIINDDIDGTVLPVLFLYRHAIEVRLKSILRPKGKVNHDIGKLIDELDRRLQSRRGFGLPVNVLARVKELNELDPGADAFRFHAKKAKIGEPGPSAHFVLEIWVHVVYLRDTMAWVDDQLRRISSEELG